MTILKTFDHKGRSLKLTAYNAPAKPARKPRAAIRRADFEINQLAFADNTLTAQISGRHIAYLFVEILIKDGDKFYGPVLREYIPANLDKQTGGLLRPDWGDPISLSIPLRPSLTLLTDGVDSAFAFCIPEGYRVSGCYLDGQFTTAAEGSQSRARITFDDDGKITEILAFKQQRMKSTPRPVTPKPGDTFAPFVQALTEEGGMWTSETILSTALTFGDQPFRLEKESLIPGEYLVGILAQDLDGGFNRKYVPMAVE
ncbi:MAG: hypothetical protein HY865_14565 [Chloroflexi bacterium]|nr:hypothetical protein [Chloroflexota bacterium]